MSDVGQGCEVIADTLLWTSDHTGVLLSAVTQTVRRCRNCFAKVPTGEPCKLCRPAHRWRFDVYTLGLWASAREGR